MHVITKEYIHFNIHNSRFALPFDKCVALEVGSNHHNYGLFSEVHQSTREEIVKTLGLYESNISFWIENVWIFGWTWTEYVKPGITIVLRNTPCLSLPEPPSPPSPPLESPITDHSSAIKLLEAEGSRRLPFSGCSTRVFTFRPTDGMTALAQLEMYQKLRTL
jgi:hypothetical protein